jgi:flagellar hook-length control protein FliK
MAFTLDTILSGRPPRESSESGNRPLSPSGKGAEFAKIHSKFETDKRDRDESDLLAGADTGQVAASAILINGPLEDGGQLDEMLAIAENTAEPAGNPQALPAAESPETSDVPLTTADAIEMPHGTLEELAPDRMEVPVDQLAAGGAGAPEGLSKQNAAEVDAVSAKLAPPVPEPDQTNVSTRPTADTDSPPEADIVALPGRADPALQSTLASAISPVAANATPTTKGSDKVGAAAPAPATLKASALTGDDVSTTSNRSARTSAPADFFTGNGEQIASTAQGQNPDTVPDIATGTKAVNPLDMAMSTQSGLPQPPAATLAPAVPITGAMTPAHSLISATPAQVVEIISDSIAAPEDQKSRIHIQLDPPELGRVSIDFKFDANGLQHVTVTGETPEALRHLRAMHFELVNALERQGLSSQNMSFQQNQTQQDPGQQAARAGRTDSDVVADADLVAASMAAARNSQTHSAAAGSLNIKL